MYKWCKIKQISFKCIFEFLGKRILRAQIQLIKTRAGSTELRLDPACEDLQGSASRGFPASQAGRSRGLALHAGLQPPGGHALREHGEGEPTLT